MGPSSVTTENLVTDIEALEAAKQASMGPSSVTTENGRRRP
jgi:hypothetical protein